MSDFTDVLDFWFGPPDTPERGRPRRCWFEKNEAFDRDVRTRFMKLHQRAAAGRLAKWERTPLAALALAVLLDQFPRNMFRGDPKAFATDGAALSTARSAVERGFDRCLRPVERWFVYLPFEHAENLAAQRRSVALFSGLDGDPDSPGTIDYARRHFEIISRFGRFPHRNGILGRTSTAEETLFLAQPGSGF
jgi:uncharacterized protein (DUF924 family)